MAEALSFPGLGLEFEISRVAFTVGDSPIYWYGIIVAVAFLAAAAYVLLRAKVFGLDGDRVMDVVLGGVLAGIIGARLYYVMFRWDTYSRDIMSVFNIREGGIAIYGGLAGGVIAAVFLCKLRRVKLLPMLDLAAGGIILGQMIGRWGNFVNMEAFGANTQAAWGMTSPSIAWYLRQNMRELTAQGFQIQPDMPVHPTFFYESMWCLLGFLFILWFTRRRRFDGEIGLIYIGWYGIGRFLIEGLRTDSLMLGTMRVSQVVALLCVLVSAITLITVLSRIKRANDPDYLKIYVDTDEGKAVIAGEFYKKKDQTADAPKTEDTDETDETGEEKAIDKAEDTAITEDTNKPEEAAAEEEPPKDVEQTGEKESSGEEQTDGDDH